MRHLLAPLVALLVLTGCSDSESKSTEEEIPVEPVTPSPARDLADCLKKAGFTVDDEDLEPASMGKEQVVLVSVSGLPDSAKVSGNGEQGADLWVFEDAAAAEANRADITLAESVTESGYVAGSTVVAFFHPVAAQAPEVIAIRKCAEALDS